MKIVGEKNYYPFGLQHKGYNDDPSALRNSVGQRFGFGGKELGDELGLNWYDVSARNYDPALGRWMNLDPLADQMRRHSPYNYAFDNPLRFIDSDGMAPDDIIIIGGDEGFRQRALAALQANTAETLELDDNGKVVITGCGGTNTCETGTDLVSDLVNSGKTVSIVETEGQNYTVGHNEEGAVSTDEGDSTIFYNSISREGGADVNGKNDREPHVGLAHELGHSRDKAEGTEPVPELSNFVEPYEDLGIDTNPNLKNIPLKSEMKVRIEVENPIRAEHGYPLRKIVPKKKFKRYGKY